MVGAAAKMRRPAPAGAGLLAAAMFWQAASHKASGGVRFFRFSLTLATKTYFSGHKS
jgi:hypothetical protein